MSALWVAFPNIPSTPFGSNPQILEARLRGANHQIGRGQMLIAVVRTLQLFVVPILLEARTVISPGKFGPLLFAQGARQVVFSL
jgi:hypothetical protein